MKHLSEEIQECIQSCWSCRHECQTVLFNHCLEMGGKHAEPAHVKIMIDCIQICQLAADAMVRKSSLHEIICATCAEICNACSESCEKLESIEMKRCAEFCRRCAESCKEMSAFNDTNRTSQPLSSSHVQA